jgi:putative solute:sodium symporter small subunit
MLATLGFWLIFAVFPSTLVVPLNRLSIPYLDLPLGYFMTTQGALIAFLLMVYSRSARTASIVITSEPANTDGKNTMTTFARSEVSDHLNSICGPWSPCSRPSNREALVTRSLLTSR